MTPLCEWADPAANPVVCRWCGVPCPNRHAAPPERACEAPRGLGDVVAKWTAAVGIKPCRGCKERREWLNRTVPFHSP